MRLARVGSKSASIHLLRSPRTPLTSLRTLHPLDTTRLLQPHLRMAVSIFLRSISSEPTWMAQMAFLPTATVLHFPFRASTPRTIGLTWSMFRLRQCQELLQRFWLIPRALRSHMCQGEVDQLPRRLLTYITNETARCRGLLHQVLLGLLLLRVPD